MQEAGEINVSLFRVPSIDTYHGEEAQSFH